MNTKRNWEVEILMATSRIRLTDYLYPENNQYISITETVFDQITAFPEQSKDEALKFAKNLEALAKSIKNYYQYVEDHKLFTPVVNINTKPNKESK